MAESSEGVIQHRSKTTLTKRGEKAARIGAAALAVTGVATLNQATDGGVTRAAKEIIGVERFGEEVAKTDSPFKLVDYQRSEDQLDTIRRTARMKPNARFGVQFDIAELETQGFNLNDISNVVLELGDEYEGPEGEFQQNQARQTAKMLEEYFGIDPAQAKSYWDFRSDLRGITYGYWLKGTVTNPKTGETMLMHLTPNFAKPLIPPTHPAEPQ